MNAGICIDCNYPLRDLTEPRCPECGRAFDPNDWQTMNLGRPMGPVVRWILGPIGWPCVLIIVAPLAWLLWAFSSPGPYYMAIVGVPAISCLLMMARALWAVIRGEVSVRYQQSYVPTNRSRRGAILLFFIVATNALIFFTIPLQIRFALSRRAMDQYVRELIAHPDAPRPIRQRVGLYDVGKSVVSQGGVIRIFFPNDDEVGFAFSQHRPDYAGANPGTDGHLQGPWYWFSDD